MQSRGLSQAKLAAAIGVYDGNVKRWRSGKGIEIENVWKLADYFGIERSYLEQLAGYGDNHISLAQDTTIDPGIAALYDAERAAVEQDLSNIPPNFHHAILTAQQNARRLAIELAQAAIAIARGPGAISTSGTGELASPPRRRPSDDRGNRRPKTEPLAGAFHPAAAY